MVTILFHASFPRVRAAGVAPEAWVGPASGVAPEAWMARAVGVAPEAWVAPAAGVAPQAEVATEAAEAAHGADKAARVGSWLRV